MIGELSHIGIAVRNLDRAQDVFYSLFGSKVHSDTATDEMRASFVEVGDISLELMEPVADEGVLAKFLGKRGEGIHHICFEVDDINAELQSLALKGIELVDKQPRQGLEGKIAFLHPRSTQGVLIELVQKK